MNFYKTPILTVFTFLLLTNCSPKTESQEMENAEVNENAIEEVKIENLLRESLELTEGVEVVMSYLELPKNTTLPSHYHPGEEFVFMLKGSGELSLKDQSKILLKAGDAVKVPLKHIHSFSTLEEDAKAVVFRVHEKGQPDRILIE